VVSPSYHAQPVQGSASAAAIPLHQPLHVTLQATHLGGGQKPAGFSHPPHGAQGTVVGRNPVRPPAGVDNTTSLL
jgi:hypothetical protein